MREEELRDRVRQAEKAVSEVLVGQEETIHLAFAALCAGGHVLLEDVPGTGKTLLARTIAQVLGLSFSRISFTPDLLPADVTGLSVYRQDEGAFRFVPGPVFTNLLLADEINRATPRTQAGLLECMQEGAVTVDGVTRPLPQPFFVLATQNPIEQAGTFPLPEAQLDRFLFRLHMTPPEGEGLTALLARFLHRDAGQMVQELGAQRSAVQESAESGREEEEQWLLQVQAAVRQVEVSPELLSYVSSLTAATGRAEGIRQGVSPRGALALLRASQSLAFLAARSFVVPEDIRRAAVPALAHRIVCVDRFESSAGAEEEIRQICGRVPLPTEHLGGRR